MTHLKDVAVTAERQLCIPDRSGFSYKRLAIAAHEERSRPAARTSAIENGHPVIMALVEGSNCNDVARESLSFGPLNHRRPTRSQYWRIKKPGG